MCNRIVNAAKCCGVYRGQSMHSFRRGSMQHRQEVLGQDLTAIGAQAKIRTPAVVARYLDPMRCRAKLKKKAAAALHRARAPSERIRQRRQGWSRHEESA